MICAYTVTWYRVLLFSMNNLPTVIRFHKFLSNTNDFLSDLADPSLEP